MSSIVLSGDTSGSVTVSVPAVSGSNTVTIPAVTGTVMVSSNMPAFSAYCSSGTSLSGNVWTKQDLQTKEFDTNNNFASSRFTPTVAGYYQINAAFSTVTAPANCFIAIYKNGTSYKQGNLITAATGVGCLCVVSSIVYCNGTIDYIEMYVLSSVGTTTSTGANTVYMNGCMLRGA